MRSAQPYATLHAAAMRGPDAARGVVPHIPIAFPGGGRPWEVSTLCEVAKCSCNRIALAPEQVITASQQQPKECAAWRGDVAIQTSCSLRWSRHNTTRLRAEVPPGYSRLSRRGCRFNYLTVRESLSRGGGGIGCKCPIKNGRIGCKCPIQNGQIGCKCPIQNGQIECKCPIQNGQIGCKCPIQNGLQIGCKCPIQNGLVPFPLPVALLPRALLSGPRHGSTALPAIRRFITPQSLHSPGIPEIPPDCKDTHMHAPPWKRKHTRTHTCATQSHEGGARDEGQPDAGAAARCQGRGQGTCQAQGGAREKGELRGRSSVRGWVNAEACAKLTEEHKKSADEASEGQWDGRMKQWDGRMKQWDGRTDSLPGGYADGWMCACVD
eukprot:359003-Chlamydomonas_euryale.AAC.2